MRKLKSFYNYTVLVAGSLLLAVAFPLSGQANLQDKSVSTYQEPVKMVVDGYYYMDAEDFSHYGGWQMDNQFVHLMGSPYLIATGVGRPVEDATTTIDITQKGKYHVWVRARNWEKEYAPGRFNLIINGKTLKNEFGAAPSDQWTWEYGGSVNLKKGDNKMVLHDLTGFYGRCDAIILTNNETYVPPEEKDAVCEERARLKGYSLEPSFAGDFDVIVVGGGSAGVPAAIAAARMGARTALIQNRPVLGGNSSKELGVAIVGAGFNHSGWREAGIIEEAELLRVKNGQTYSSDAFMQLCEAEENLTVFMNQHVFDAMIETDKAIKGVRSVSTITGKITEYTGKMFIDCTGDGWLGYFAGAAYRYGRESKYEFNESLAPDTADQITMSGCLMGGYQQGFGTAFRSRKTDHPVNFIRPPWAREINDLIGYGRRIHQIDRGNWWMEHEGTVNDVLEAEQARDELIKVTFSFWDFVKNKGDIWDYASDLKGQEDEVKYYELATIPIMNARRETRRLEGDYLVTQNDVLSGRIFPDRIAYAGWPLDIHHPEGIYSGPAGSFQYDISGPINTIPYRSVYSKNIDNLFFAGRCGSFTHLGMGSLRVQSTLATVGQAAGTAAAMCIEKNISPRDIYYNHMNELQQTLLKYDQSIPGFKNEDSSDLARNAKATASSHAQLDDFPLKIPLSRKTKAIGIDEYSTIIEVKDYNDLHSIRLNFISQKNEEAILDVQLIGLDTKKEPVKLNKSGLYTFNKKGNSQGWFGIPLSDLLNEQVEYLEVRVFPEEGIFWPALSCLYQPELANDQKPGYAPKNVINGWTRIAENYQSLWVSDPAESLPQWIELDFDKTTEFNTVQLTFDTDLSTGQPDKIKQDVCVKSYRISVLSNGKWTEVASADDNFQRHRIHSFSSVKANKLRLEILSTNGSSSARVYEIRVYNEDTVGAFVKKKELRDISSVPFDLSVPDIKEGPPAPGKRVKHQLASYKGTEIYHVLYLPENWEKGKKYPVIIEYPGNGPFRNKYGDVCTGKPDDASLGYGIGGGKDFIWVAMPFVSKDLQQNQIKWWGDIDASVDYTMDAVNMICDEFGGDEDLVFVTGFSRGAIACNYIGLHNDEIADLWCAFMPFSHYDGMTDWGYPGADKESAVDRMRRINGRPQLIMNEKYGTGATREFIESTGIEGDFTYLDIPYRNHDDKWVLQDIPQRKFMRDWVRKIVNN